MDRRQIEIEEERHWRSIALPMPARWTAIDPGEILTLEESARVVHAVYPGDMAEKWIVLVEGDHTVHFHRSWTGFLIYSVTFVCCPGEEGEEPYRYVVGDVMVNRDPSQYACTDDALDAARVVWLVRTLLLHQDVEMPADPSVSPEDALLDAWAFGGSAGFSGPVPDADPAGDAAGASTPSDGDPPDDPSRDR